MTDAIVTARYSLPMLALAQAQKEMTHNEALALVDALIHPAVEDGPANEPPAEPAVGACWLVGDAATGDWAGHDGDMAIWTDGGWRFVAPREAMAVTRLADGVRLRFADGVWTAPPAVAAPGGGAVIDAESRAAIGALIAALVGQGLLISA